MHFCEVEKSSAVLKARAVMWKSKNVEVIVVIFFRLVLLTPPKARKFMIQHIFSPF